MLRRESTGLRGVDCRGSNQPYLLIVHPHLVFRTKPWLRPHLVYLYVQYCGTSIPLCHPTLPVGIRGHMRALSAPPSASVDDHACRVTKRSQGVSCCSYTLTLALLKPLAPSQASPAPPTSLAKIPWGNRGRAEETDSKPVCVQMIRWMWVCTLVKVGAFETHSTSEPVCKNLCLCLSRMLTCEWETRYVRFK